MPEIMFSKKEFQIWDFESFIFWSKFLFWGGTTLGRFSQCFFIFFFIGQPWWPTFLQGPLPHHKKDSYDPVMGLIPLNIMKMKMKMNNRSHRYDINNPRPRQGYKYGKYKKCWCWYMLIWWYLYVLSNILSSIHEALNNTEVELEKSIPWKSHVFYCGYII